MDIDPELFKRAVIAGRILRVAGTAIDPRDDDDDGAPTVAMRLAEEWQEGLGLESADVWLDHGIWSHDAACWLEHHAIAPGAVDSIDAKWLRRWQRGDYSPQASAEMFQIEGSERSQACTTHAERIVARVLRDQDVRRVQGSEEALLSALVTALGVDESVVMRHALLVLGEALTSSHPDVAAPVAAVLAGLEASEASHSASCEPDGRGKGP